MVLTIVFLAIAALLINLTNGYISKKVLPEISMHFATSTFIRLTNQTDIVLPALLTIISASIAGEGALSAGIIMGTCLWIIFAVTAALLFNNKLKISAIYAIRFLGLPVVGWLFFAFLFSDGTISRMDGLGLIISFILIYALIFYFKNRISAHNRTEKIILNRFKFSLNKKSAILLFGALVVMLSGIATLIVNAVKLSEALGISSATTGLIVAAPLISLSGIVKRWRTTIENADEHEITGLLKSTVLIYSMVAGIAAIINPLTTLSFSKIDFAFPLIGWLLLIPLKKDRILKRDDAYTLLLFYGIYLMYVTGLTSLFR